MYEIAFKLRMSTNGQQLCDIKEEILVRGTVMDVSLCLRIAESAKLTLIFLQRFLENQRMIETSRDSIE